MDFIKMIMGGRQQKKIPLVILSQETELLFLEKRLGKIREAHSAEHKATCEKYEKQTTEVWGKITDFLISKGLIKHKDEQVAFNDGVLYRLEDNDE